MLLFAFLVGLLINALGYIPPGNINLSVAQLTINRGMRQAWYFMLAFSFVEVFFTFGMMHFARWMSRDISLDVSVKQIKLDTLTDGFMILMFLVMGTITWVSRNKMPKTNQTAKKGSSIMYGIILGVVNPVQIPTWIFFGNYVIIHQWIQTDGLTLFIFSIGSGIGSAITLYGYAHFARYIQEKFALSTQLINHSIAIFLYFLAFTLLVKQTYIYW